MPAMLNWDQEDIDRRWSLGLLVSNIYGCQDDNRSHLHCGLARLSSLTLFESVARTSYVIAESVCRRLTQDSLVLVLSCNLENQVSSNEHFLDCPSVTQVSKTSDTKLRHKLAPTRASSDSVQNCPSLLFHQVRRTDTFR